MNVIVIIQRSEEIGHFFALRIIQFSGVFRDVTHFGSDDFPTGCFQGF